MRRSLSEYSCEYSSRRELCDALTPQAREIKLSPLKFPEQIAAEISKLLSFMKNAAEQQIQPINIVIHSPRKKFKQQYRFPYFGLGNVCASPAVKVSILLNLLKCVLTKLNLGEKCTIRDVYYLNVELFQKQRVVSDWLRTIEEAFELPSRDCLHVVAAQKGLCHAPVRLNYEKTWIPGGQTTLVPYINDFTQLHADWSQIEHITVLEKDSIFNKLVVDEKITATTLLVTGKGYPDFLTRLFLNRLMICAPPEVTFEIFTDSDPYGIDIAMRYIYNADKSIYACPRAQYRGVFIHELLNNTVKTSGMQLLPLAPRDRNYACNLLQKLIDAHIPNPNKRHFSRELQRQLFFCKKAEMNTVANCTFTDYFLEKKNRGELGIEPRASRMLVVNSPSLT